MAIESEFGADKLSEEKEFAQNAFDADAPDMIIINQSPVRCFVLYIAFFVDVLYRFFPFFFLMNSQFGLKTLALSWLSVCTELKVASR